MLITSNQTFFIKYELYFIKSQFFLKKIERILLTFSYCKKMDPLEYIIRILEKSLIHQKDKELSLFIKDLIKYKVNNTKF